MGQMRSLTVLAVAVLPLVFSTPAMGVADIAKVQTGAAFHQGSAKRAQTDGQQLGVRSSKRTRPLALVYRGPASCQGCSEAAARLVKSARQKFRVAYVGPKERRKLTTSTLRKAALYVQPGGDTSVARADKLMGAKAKKLIIRYVRDGGRYLGICQGAYLAGSMPGMGLLQPGNTGQYIATEGASTNSTRDTVIPVRWGAKHRSMFFQDGPYFTTGSARGVQVHARYTNGRIAALTKRVGAGRIGVVGPHPEAPASWYRAIGAKNYSKQGRVLGHRLINSAMARR